MTSLYLCIHGHFYQPPRQHPSSGIIAHDPEAAPYHDFNEKIWDECYRPNAEHGNFAHMSFNIGPTLADWLEKEHPATMRRIIDDAQGRDNGALHGNGLAQAYHHTILPLATPLEKRLQILWGYRDFCRRFGVAPEGMWLPETAVDLDTLSALAEQGLRYTVLAPWQAVRADIDTTQPYIVRLPHNRSIVVFFYHAALSGAVSFHDDATSDAARFATHYLPEAINRRHLHTGTPQLTLIATDGEAYGHHKPLRDWFLARLLQHEASSHNITVTSLSAYLDAYPPQQYVDLRPSTSWSCHHGVARWERGCHCTDGDASWKGPLRRSLRALATRLDALYLAETTDLLHDPWRALEDYLDLRDGAVSASTFWATHAAQPLDRATQQRLHGLLEMQFVRQAMFVSCAWFFEDLDRREPRIALGFARQAVALAAQHTGAHLEPELVDSLYSCVSVRSGRTAAELYRAL